MTKKRPRNAEIDRFLARLRAKDIANEVAKQVPPREDEGWVRCDASCECQKCERAAPVREAVGDFMKRRKR